MSKVDGQVMIHGVKGIVIFADSKEIESIIKYLTI